MEIMLFLAAFHSLLCSLCIFNDVIEARVPAQEAISERQGMGARLRTLLHTLSKSVNSNFNDTAVFQTAHGLGCCFQTLMSHERSPVGTISQEKLYR
jgi:hypothetical protein